MHTAQFNSNST